MAKKRKQQVYTSNEPSYNEKESLTLKDQLGGDVLEKLKAAKNSLTKQVQEKEEERQAQLVFERKQKEKNMSFEELLNQYGDGGTKF